MGSHETFAFPHELQQLFALRRIERNLAVSHEEDRVDVAEIRSTARGRSVGLLRRGRDDVRVGADERVPLAGLVAKLLDDRERVADRLVLGLTVARVRPCEDALARRAAATATTAAS